MKHSELANDILKKIGGKENVSNLTHCVTRLRFELKDNTIPNVAEVEALEGVMKVVDTGAQLQVVIGNKVKEVYEEVLNVMGGEVNLEENSTQDKGKTETKTTKKGKLFDRFAAMISGIFAPTLGVMAGTGMLKGLLSVLLVTKVLSADTGTYKILYAISDAIIYFFPIFLGASAVKYFKLNQYTGIAIGAIMLYPSIIEIASKNAPISFMGLPMTISNYSSTVFPVILAAWFASKLEEISDKYAPKSVDFFLVPLIVLVVMIPLTFFVVGPLMIGLGVVLSKAVSSVYYFSPILGGIALGGFLNLGVKSVEYNFDKSTNNYSSVNDYENSKTGIDEDAAQFDVNFKKKILGFEVGGALRYGSSHESNLERTGGELYAKYNFNDKLSLKYQKFDYGYTKITEIATPTFNTSTYSWGVSGMTALVTGKENGTGYQLDLSAPGQWRSLVLDNDVSQFGNAFLGLGMTGISWAGGEFTLNGKVWNSFMAYATNYVDYGIKPNTLNLEYNSGNLGVISSLAYNN